MTEAEEKGRRENRTTNCLWLANRHRSHFRAPSHHVPASTAIYRFNFFCKSETQEAHKRNSNWLPPRWAILAMVILGFNEFMLLLRNPLYLLLSFVIFLLAKAVWVQMDIFGEFRDGALLFFLEDDSVPIQHNPHPLPLTGPGTSNDTLEECRTFITNPACSGWHFQSRFERALWFKRCR